MTYINSEFFFILMNVFSLLGALLSVKTCFKKQMLSGKKEIVLFHEISPARQGFQRIPYTFRHFVQGLPAPRRKLPASHDSLQL